MRRFDSFDLFGLTNWRAYAFTLGVMFTGVAMGVQYAHPSLQLWPLETYNLVAQPGASAAKMVSDVYFGIAALALVAVAGQEALVGREASG